MQVTLIVLFAYWCPKCNMMMPVVDEIEEVYKEQLEVVRIGKIIVSKLYRHLL